VARLYKCATLYSSRNVAIGGHQVVISDHQVVISDRVLQRAAVAMRLGRSETLRRRRRRERRLGRPTTCCCSTQREKFRTPSTARASNPLSFRSFQGPLGQTHTHKPRGLTRYGRTVRRPLRRSFREQSKQAISLLASGSLPQPCRSARRGVGCTVVTEYGKATTQVNTPHVPSKYLQSTMRSILSGRTSKDLGCDALHT
jgi:hypothetical protein